MTALATLPATYLPSTAAELAPILTAYPVTVSRVAPGDLYAALLADARTEPTRRARTQDVADLGRFLGLAEPAAVCQLLVAGDSGQANALGLAYRDSMQSRQLSAATINRRLSTLRRLVALARRFNLISWEIDLDGLQAAPYRDTRGPGLDGWRRLWEAATAAGDGRRAVRDRAIIRLTYSNALRRAELVGIDLADVDLDGMRVAIKGKGRTAKEWVTISATTAAALAEWIGVRGNEPGPLFLNCDRSSKGGGRLTGDGVRVILKALSALAGLARPARPHGLRHAAISRALDLTNGNVRVVQRFARHCDPATTQRYDDAREDLAGVVVRLLGADE